MTDETRALKEAIDLIKWTLVDAIEMNPESKDEIQDAWSLIIESIR